MSETGSEEVHVRLSPCISRRSRQGSEQETRKLLQQKSVVCHLGFLSQKCGIWGIKIVRSFFRSVWLMNKHAPLGPPRSWSPSSPLEAEKENFFERQATNLSASTDHEKEPCDLSGHRSLGPAQPRRGTRLRSRGTRLVVVLHPQGRQNCFSPATGPQLVVRVSVSGIQKLERDRIENAPKTP